MKVAFAYPNPRTQLAADVAAGRAPDTGLLGQNHLADLGIDAEAVDSALRRGRRVRGPLHRLTWYAREVSLPFELRRFDLVFTSLSTLLPLVARLRGRPGVVLLSFHLLHVDERSGPARRRLLRAAVRSCSALVCASESAREKLLVRFGLEPDRIHTALLGVDERWWRPTSRPEDGYILAVGRDLARDYTTLARAVETLPVRTIVVAKRENLAGIRLPTNVEVRFDLSSVEVRELYEGAACVVVPVRRHVEAAGTENSGTIALLEAMACARPLVVSANEYLAEYLTDGHNALTVPPEEPDALHGALERLLGDAPLAERLGAEARRHVEASHTTRMFAERLVEVFRSLEVVGVD